MSKGFQVKVKGNIVEIILNRPQKRNSLLPEFWKDFPETIRRLSQSGKYKVCILSGQGPDFCSGMDLSVFANNDKLKTDSIHSREHFYHLIRLIQSTLSELEEARFPVIAAIQGNCLGAGLELAAACDLRYSTNAARFRIEETNIGIMADLGSLQRLPKLMPEAVVKEMAYLGNTLSAQRAYEIGFLNDVLKDACALEKSALQAAQNIAQKPPLVISSSKRCINYTRDHTLSDALNQAALMQSTIFDLSEIERAFKNSSHQFLSQANLAELDTEL